MSINDKVNSLILEIKGTSEYNSLVKARTVIDRNSELKNKLAEFNKKQTETFEGKISDKDFESRAKELDNMYNQLLKIKEINEFMKVSKSFDELMSKIYKSVNEGIFS